MIAMTYSTWVIAILFILSTNYSNPEYEYDVRSYFMDNHSSLGLAINRAF